jgi:hypothetical protein
VKKTLLHKKLPMQLPVLLKLLAKSPQTKRRVSFFLPA